MLHSVRGVFDGKRLELEEKVSVRKPVKIAPLKVKELIEEGRR